MPVPSQVEVEVDEKAERADITAPSGCPACDGPVFLRLSPGRAWSLCPACHRLSSARVSMTDEGLVLSHAGLPN